MEGPEAVLEARRSQRMAALAKGNAVRKRNALVKQLLKERKVTPEDLIAGTIADDDVAEALEQAIRSWPVKRLVLAVPGIGDTRSQEVLAVFRCSPRTVVSALSFERRAELAGLVRAARVG